MANIPENSFSNFFKNKSILSGYRFTVSIPSLYFTGAPANAVLFKKFKEYTGEFMTEPTEGFKLKTNLVKNVSLPDFSFSKGGGVKYGPTTRSAPILDFDGYELKLDLEEDDKGSVKQFIEHCQSRNVHKSGLYWPTEFAEIPGMDIHILDPEFNSVIKYMYKNLIFLNASEVILDYSAAESIKYTLMFSALSVSTEHKNLQ